MIDVVVVGSGPNGLAAAVTLARAGVGVQVLEAASTPGGGARTTGLGLADGVIHDLCSAVHPLAWASPFFRRFDLEAHGVELLTPEVSYAQPLPGGRSAVAYRDLTTTVNRLGPDGRAWRRLFSPLVERVHELVALALGDRRTLIRALSGSGTGTAARFAGRVAGQVLPGPVSLLGDGPGAALLTGVAAHANTRVTSPAATATGVLLATLAHAGHGWAIPRGGSQAITNAMVADLRAHGGEIVLDHPVITSRDLPPARAYVADTSPRAAATIFSSRITASTASRLRAFRHGAGVAKVDFVLSGPVPWSATDVDRAATVHLGGSRIDMMRNEDAVARGRHALAPVTLVSDPTVVDVTRMSGGMRPLWSYAHVPSGSDRDMTEAVTSRIEEAAPGFRDVVVASRCVPASEMPAHNRNYVAGDVLGGAVTLRGMVARPTLSTNPYRIGPDTYLCSASVPPGPGVHGLSGSYAARRVLSDWGRHETT